MRWGALGGIVVAIGCRAAGDAAPPCAGLRCTPLPDCPAGQIALRDSGCVSVGVPLGGCDKAFRHDGAGGCEPILPATPCVEGTMPSIGSLSCRPVGPASCGEGFAFGPEKDCIATLPAATCAKGTLAIPGDTACHEPSECPADPFGAPTGAAIYVDASYAGADADGTRAKPYATLTAALLAASATTTTTIVVAAGRYDGRLLVDKAVRLLGRCASMVEITATDTAIEIRHADVEIARVSITSSGVGVKVASKGAKLDAIVVHDTGAEGVFATADVSVTGSLIERATSAGMLVLGGTSSIEQSAVRETRSTAGEGEGVVAQKGATLTVRRCHLEKNRVAHVSLTAATATIESTLLRDTLASAADGQMGFGLYAAALGTAPSTMTVRKSVIEHARHVGVVVLGSIATLEDVSVRDTELLPSGLRGHGLDAAPGALPADVTVRRSTFTRNHEAAISVTGSRALVVASWIRKSLPQGDGTFGDGLYVAPLSASAAVLPELTVRDSLVEDAHGGVVAFGANVTVEGSTIRDMKLGAGGVGGHCVSFEQSTKSKNGSSGTLRGSLLERCRSAGVHVVTSTALIEGSVVRDTLPTADGSFGRGLAAEGTGPCIVNVRTSLFERNMDVGIMLAGTTGSIERTVVRDGVPQKDGKGGRGIGIEPNALPGIGSTVTVRECTVLRNTDVGIAIFSSDVTVESTLVADTRAMASGKHGDGILMSPGTFVLAPHAVVRRCLVVGNRDVGVVGFGGPLELVDSVVRGTLPQGDGSFGDGVGIAAWYDRARDTIRPGTLSLVRTQVQGSARAGVIAIGSSMSLTGSDLTCNSIDLDIESFTVEGGGLPTVTSNTAIDEADNVCGCGDHAPCRGQSANLAPISVP